MATRSAVREQLVSSVGRAPRHRWGAAAVGGAALPAILSAFLVTRAMIVFIIYLSARLLPRNPYFHDLPPSFHYLRNPVLDGLVRWDSGWYADIALHGYSIQSGPHAESNVAFFPLYPLAVKILAIPLHNVYIAGLLISNAAFLVALCYLYALTRHELDDDTAGRAVFYLSAVPAAIIFAAMYTESLFIALVAATFYYARRGRWLPAAVAGALGAATRNTGVFLALVVALEALNRGGYGWPGTGELRPRAALARLRRQIAPVAPDRRGLAAAAAVPAGLLAYMAYLGARFRDPLAFLRAQSRWTGISTREITHALGVTAGGVTSGGSSHVGLIYFDASALVVFAPLVLAVVLTMRPSYGVYALLTYALPPILGHGLLSSMRFTLMLLPCYMLLARWGRRPWVDRLILGVSLPLLGYFALTFSHWYEVPSM